MLFNSFKFWIIFCLLFLFYWIIPSKWHKTRKIYLILVSYALYMAWEPWFAINLLWVTAITYFGAVAIEGITKRRKFFCWMFSILALLPLFTFKYYNFVNDIFFHIFSSLGLSYSIPGLNWAIPVGISFFTFQAMGYFFDVYRKKEMAERSFIDYMLFCSFFPQTASGPISTAAELLPQIKSQKKFTFENGVLGLKWVLWGIVLKCVFADRLGLYVDTVFNNYEHFSGINCAVAALFFTLQIYGDFAGYSLMAIGIAKTLGFDLINNFKRPYLADSITEFWKRWHISLTRWLTRYVYIPLGGNRCSKSRQYCNIMITFLVSGLWHGANYTFVVWGGLHGGAQITEKAMGIDPNGKHSKNKWILRAKPLRILVTFTLVTIAWIFFRMPTIGDAVNFIGRIFSNHTSQQIMYKASNSDKLLTLFAIILIFAAEIRAEYLREKTTVLDTSWARWLIYILLFVIILVVGVLDAGSFIYVNF